MPVVSAIRAVRLEVGTLPTDNLGDPLTSLSQRADGDQAHQIFTDQERKPRPGSARRWRDPGHGGSTFTDVA